MVQKGIWDCLKLYTEAPPKGSKTNFGLAALKRWADLLVNPNRRLSWAKEFPPGPKMYAGLTSNSLLADLNTEIAAAFPLTQAEVIALRENLRTHLLKIHNLELEAVTLLQAAMN